MWVCGCVGVWVCGCVGVVGYTIAQSSKYECFIRAHPSHHASTAHPTTFPRPSCFSSTTHTPRAVTAQVLTQRASAHQLLRGCHPWQHCAGQSLGHHGRRGPQTLAVQRVHSKATRCTALRRPEPGREACAAGPCPCVVNVHKAMERKLVPDMLAATMVWLRLRKATADCTLLFLFHGLGYPHSWMCGL